MKRDLQTLFKVAEAADEARSIEALTARLAAAMRKQDGRDFRVLIDHQAGFVMVMAASA